MQPPLVKDLFGTNFAGILGRYPLAQAAATDIRRAIAPESENAVPLERYLRDQMRDAANLYTKRRYRQIPLYLQDLLLTVSDIGGSGYTTDPDNFNALINRTLDLDDVLLLTLNYDPLVDDRLFIYGDLQDLNSYVASDPRWALVKLHGSVNWGRRIIADINRGIETVNQANASGRPISQHELINKLIDTEYDQVSVGEIELRLHRSLDEWRYDRSDSVYYPALSIPVGEEDELVCPSEHLAAARERLGRADALNILVIGYSGLDREVLQLLRQSGRPAHRLLVVNGSERASFEAAERIQQACGGSGVRTDSVFRGGFSEVVRTGTLADFAATIPG